MEQSSTSCLSCSHWVVIHRFLLSHSITVSGSFLLGSVAILCIWPATRTVVFKGRSSSSSGRSSMISLQEQMATVGQ